MTTFYLKSIRSGKAYPLDKPAIMIGRIESCDIHIQTTVLSREHAVVLVAAARVLIKDLDSTNGTFVNSMRIHTPTALHHGDVVTIGAEKLVFIAPDSFEEEGNTCGIGERLESSAYLNNTSSKTMLKSNYLQGEDSPFQIQQPKTTGSFLETIEERLTDRKIDKRRVPAVLVCRSGKEKGRIVELKLPLGAEKNWVIGRSDLSDVVLDDPTVSGQHAIIRCQDDRWELIDNDSTNGVKLNGIGVSEAECQDADIISVGTVELLFRIIA